MKETGKMNQHREVAGDEYLDLVNEHDQVIGRALRSTIYKDSLSNFRVVNGFVKNKKGQLWIPIRQADKLIFPRAFDFSIGEHVESGESYDAAFRRGAKEELQIQVDLTEYSLLGKLTPKDNVSSYMQVYAIPSEIEPDYNTKDFSGGSWLYPDELRTMIQNGKPAKSDLIIVLNHFYPTFLQIQ